MSRRRQLSDEERALWTGLARSIKPLRRSVKSGEPVGKEFPTAPEKPSASGAAAAREGQPRAAALRKTPPPSVKPPAPPPLAPLGRRLKQRVARGRAPIEARLDLHGLTQLEARAALLDFLHRAQADGARIALVVTGKGSGGGDDPLARGVLRRQVPLWLALPEFRPFVVGFEDAHSGHGGQGALYVRLRRGR